MRVRLTGEAEADVDEALDLHAARDDTGELADRFLDELARIRHLVEERPHTWPEIEPGVRHVVLRRFLFQ